MLKAITVCICDICGETAPAKTFDYQYNQPCYDMPDGWQRGKTSGVHMCPTCAAILAIREHDKEDA